MTMHYSSSLRSSTTATILLMLLAIIHGSMALKSHHDFLTRGFNSISLNQSNLVLQSPYNLPGNERYSWTNGVQNLWVFKSDKPHSNISRTPPRSEIRIDGYDYSSGVWQFEGYFYVPYGTSGVNIMQIFGGAKHATTLMLLVRKNGNLTYYTSTNVIVQSIYDKWFKLNVIHDVTKSKVRVYINGILKFEAPGRGGNYHYFKYGVYAQIDSSSCMESRWKGVRILRK